MPEGADAPAFHSRAVRSSTRVGTAAADGRASGKYAIQRAALPPDAPHLPAITEEPSGDFSPGGTDTSYSPFADESAALSAADVMEEAVRRCVLLAASEGHSSVAGDLVPISPWAGCSRPPPPGTDAVPVLLALRRDEELTPRALCTLQAALRADSPGAPATHADAVRAGDVWMQAERKELENHRSNSSWTTISASEVPAGRRVHKLIWVYKLKRDGTAKARLCVQGNTLE